MAQSPLELYEEAYRLHHHDKKIIEAVRRYEAVIREFPDSNECAYSVIQLQKIKASDITRAFKKAPQGVYSLFVVALITALFALAIALTGTILLYRQLNVEHQRTTLAISALSKMYCNDETSALKSLDELKAISRRDALAFEISADIYRNHDQPVKAPPIAPPPVTSSETSAMVDTEPPPPPIVFPSPAKSAALKPRPSAAKPAQKQGKSPLIVPRDSISYF